MNTEGRITFRVIAAARGAAGLNAVRRHVSLGYVRRASLGGLLLLAMGCAGHPRPPVRPAPEALPPGSPLLSRTLSDSDAWLRHYLMVGAHQDAIAAATTSRSLAPRDPLVRALQEALIRHHAGDYEGSNRALEWAEIEADRRYTRSVSRAAASLLINDGVLAYTPPAGELLMVPYYRMLNYLALRDLDAALVESRKANALLARLPSGVADRCREHGLLQYLAGLVQRAGRESNDALVSLRLAERSFMACGSPPEVLEHRLASDLWHAAHAAGVPEMADSIAERIATASTHDPSGGDLVLLLEHGYVAHRAEQTLHIPLFPEDVEGLESGDEDGIATAAGRIVTRLMNNLSERRAMGRAWDDSPAVQWANAIEGAYILRLAWPAIRLEASRPAAVRVWVGDSLVTATTEGDLSAILQDDLEAHRGAILTRAVARGIIKFLAAREVEKKTDEKSGDVAAFLVGRIANIAANHFEQADLRSWSLLPDRISMVRVRLPPGTYPIRLESLARDHSVVRVDDLGKVTVRSGELSVVNRRVWGADSGTLVDPPSIPLKPSGDEPIQASAPPAAELNEHRPEP